MDELSRTPRQSSRDIGYRALERMDDDQALSDARGAASAHPPPSRPRGLGKDDRRSSSLLAQRDAGWRAS
jgi:hypothetical protein